MKNTTLIFRIFLNRIYLVPLFVLFSTNTFCQYTFIPDSNFEQVLIDLGLDDSIDHEVLTNNISGVTNLNVSNKSIISLIGIKDFTSLTFLQCNDNSITDLDVGGMTQLNYLYCQNNTISNLNISGLTNLWELVTSNNPLSIVTLDLHESPDLYYLFCENNGLTAINISGLTNLHDVGMLGNSIVTLDLSNNLELNYLDCDDNAFTNINVTGLSKLNYFYCSSNQLTTIDVTGVSSLTEFYCNNNILDELDIRGLSSLDYFDCSTNSSLSCILVDDVNAASVKDTAGNWVKDNTANYSYCNCSLTTTWTSASGGSWDNGAPTDGTYAAIISADYNQSADINACSLTIADNAVVTIPTGSKVTLNAPIIVTSGSSFTLSNNANLIQTNKNSINSGAIVVNRTSNPLFRLDYSMWSSPVAGQNLLAFSPATTLERYYTYNSMDNTYNGIDASTNSFSMGKGYLIRMPNTNPIIGYDAGTATLEFPGLFTGVPNNGDVSLAVTNGTYNAIGNPYPSVINADDFINGNSTDGTLYFWRKTNGASGTAYATYNLAGAVVTSDPGNGDITPNGHIQVGQGFIVKATSTALKFTNSMRETAPTSSQILKTKQDSSKDRIWLNLTNTSGVFSQTLLAYMDGATVGVDNRIDGKYINDSPIALTSNINGGEYTIQGRPAFDASDEVLLNFKTNVAGEYSIGIDHVDGLFASGQNVYLVDGKTGIETDLKTGAYTFLAATGTDNTRFSLKYQKTLKIDASVFNENSVKVYTTNGTLFVNSGSNTIGSIKVFDIQGKLIAERKNVKANMASISNLKATHQVLIVKVTSNDNTVVNKKVVY